MDGADGYELTGGYRQVLGSNPSGLVSTMSHKNTSAKGGNMEDIKQKIIESLEEKLELEVDENDIEIPDAEHGDFAYPVMKAASELGEYPRELAEKLKEEIELDKVQSIEVAGPGYLNFYLDREEASKDILDSAAEGFEDKGEKVVVEHTSPNPNKPLHMGTMRCAVLGDTIARVADFNGFEVEVQDYINDLGRQSARTVYAQRNFMDELDEEEKEKKADFWVGRLYSIAGQHIEDNPDEEQKVDNIIKESEKLDTDTFEELEGIVEKSLRGQLQTAYNSNVFYDLVAFESDTIQSGLYDEALELLKGLDKVYTVEEGGDEGCLVMDISEYEEELGGLKKPYKILKRSNGTATYITKDIALTLWKFGVLEGEFGYEEFDRQPNGEKLYTTGGPSLGDFGNADRVINVIGKPQAYLQQVIKFSLKAMGYEQESENLNHLDFKFVYLPGKVAYSGRKGNWVGKHGDAVLEKCQELALDEIQDRYDFSDEKEKEIAEKVGVAAVRYFLLKFSREKDIDFSFEKALDWEGDSGPYLLYSNARAHGIIDDAEEKPVFSNYEKEIEYQLIRKLSEFEEVVEDTFDSQEPTRLTHYTKDLAETFNSFYHKCPVNSAETEELKKSRLKITEGFIRVMEQSLQLMGIESLDEM